MPSKKTLALLITVLLGVWGGLTTAIPAFASSAEKVLYSFNANEEEGWYPAAGLVRDVAGNLYGATSQGGAYGYGVVFQLVAGAGGVWSENVIYNFCPVSGCADGGYPLASNLIFDAAGNLYGTTTYGGAYQPTCGGTDCGTVFELSPNGDGTWTETVLHSFGNGKDGREPATGVISDAAGNLYGTTYFGGAEREGTVFELAPSSSGAWTETVLHDFCSTRGCPDGSGPSGLVLDGKGDLYGTAPSGGSHSGSCHEIGCGVVFRLVPGTHGKWKENVLYTFTDSDRGPGGNPTLDAARNLYATTPDTVFELQKKGAWSKKVLHRFGKGKDGADIGGSLVFDSSGNLYGTTVNGGAYHTCSDGSGCGTVFRLTPLGNGKWTEKILHSFNDNGRDGYWPSASVIFDPAGNLYSTTGRGGSSGSGCGGYGCGTVFEITP